MTDKIACRVCIFTRGLRGGAPNQPLFDTDDELYEHLEQAHHLVVERVGETYEDAARRILATGHPCPQCVAELNSRLGRATLAHDDGPFTTHTGKRLTDADIEALAEEADRGYCVERIGTIQMGPHAGQPRYCAKGLPCPDHDSIEALLQGLGAPDAVERIAPTGPMPITDVPASRSWFDRMRRRRR